MNRQLKLRYFKGRGLLSRNPASAYQRISLPSILLTILLSFLSMNTLANITIFFFAKESAISEQCRIKCQPCVPWILPKLLLYPSPLAVDERRTLLEIQAICTANFKLVVTPNLRRGRRLWSRRGRAAGVSGGGDSRDIGGPF